MNEIMDYLREINLVSVAVRLVLAMIIGGIIGIERGKQGRAAGMRTHILVCLGATLSTLIGFYTFYKAYDLGITSDPLRVAAQVISGIGFLGVGTILIKGRFQITGLTTAAGLWCAAAIGISLGAGFYEAALIASVCAILTITVVHRLEYTINKKYRRFGIYVEIKSDSNVRRTVDFMKSSFKISDVQVTAPRSGTQGNVGIEANVYNDDLKTSPDEIAKIIEAEDEVVFAIESI